MLLSDVNGLYSDDPRTNPAAELIPLVERVTPQIERLARNPRNPFGTGGMVTKIQAAKRCSTAGIAIVIANGSVPRILDDLFAGRDEVASSLRRRPPSGCEALDRVHRAREQDPVTIDDGACVAVLRRRTACCRAG